ncbi:class I SAM-dependent RNA methyltransferase [bacterium]|nr:class I SAM-dependent RNA methyltransferase [bacterium]
MKALTEKLILFFREVNENYFAKSIKLCYTPDGFIKKLCIPYIHRSNANYLPFPNTCVLMNNKDTIKLRIQDVVYRGRGLARLDGMVYFVDGVLPGELVRARIRKQRKNCAEADLVEVLEESSSRVVPSCEFAKKCEGCCYQHMEHDAEIELKQKQLVNLLEHVGGCSEVTCREPVRCPSALGYRNKISMHVKGRGDGRAFGYYMKDNKTVLDVPNCPLAMDPLNNLLTELRKDSSFGHDTSVSLRYTEHDGAVYWTNRIVPPSPRLIEKTPLGNVSVPTKSFFQTNPQVTEALFDSLSEILNRTEPKTVIDLYCGVGTFAFTAAKVGVKAVLGIDTDKRAINAAIRNGRTLDLTSAVFRHGYAEDLLEEALDKIDVKDTVIILDPPRAGLEKRVVEILSRKKPRDIIYVSCAADTMARDVKFLTSHSYRLIDTGLVDMFPRTAYFESITHLSSSIRT